MTQRIQKTVKVWSVATRLFHWSLVASVATAWLTSDEFRSAHELAGYCALGLVAFRVIQGLIGERYARFSQFVRSPVHTLKYLGSMARGREARYIGHNPAGALMVLALLVTVFGTGLTGWMQTTDTWWGIEWVEEVHEVLANSLLVLIALHVAGVILASHRHGENLVRAMVNGKKPAPGSGDIG
ncbi:MAG: cytochrome b/b6 domain-containing protein [Rhizobiaceae bacterium]|nr:cytochrome b/b6 domain-containing protein [Rhizobiaceae bacterium]